MFLDRIPVTVRFIKLTPIPRYLTDVKRRRESVANPIVESYLRGMGYLTKRQHSSR